MDTTVDHPPADREAHSAILEHHAALRRQLDEHVYTLGQAVQTSAGMAEALSALRIFLTDSVLAHAMAEERTLYPAAGANDRAALLVDALIAEHRALGRWTHALGDGRSPARSLALAERIAGAFTLHVDKETNLLLPVLSRLPGVSLAALLHAMHEAMMPSPSGQDGVCPLD